MKNKKKTIVLMIQLLVLIIFVLSYKSYTDSILKPVKVWKFARNIDEKVKITDKDIYEGEIAANSYTDNMILVSDTGSIVGRYTTTNVVADTYCYYPQFGDLKESDTSFASLDLTNTRILSLPIDLINDAGGDLTTGDRIDLVFTGNGSSAIAKSGADGQVKEEDESFFYSKVFMQDIIVYNTLTSDGYKYEERAERYSGEPAPVNAAEGANVDSGTLAIVSIIVTPEQAEQIKVRQNVGSVNILKRFDESETHDTLGYVLGNYGKIFSGNANAETSSLQIISTIQDTDTEEDQSVVSTDANGKATNTATTAGISTNKSNSSSDSNQSAESENGIIVAGTDSIE